MKNDKLSRLTALVEALVGFVLLVWLLLGATFPNYLGLLQRIYEKAGWTRMAVAVVSIVLMALLANKTWSVLFPLKDEGTRTVGLKNVEGGSVQVSLTALEAMARHAVGEQPGVKDVDVFLTEAEDGLNVKIDMRVDASVRVPELTGGMQTRVKDAVEGFTGMDIKDMTVMVSDIVENKGEQQ